MRSKYLKILILLFSFGFVYYSEADYLVASRSGTVKNRPESGAGIVSRVEDGDFLMLLDNGDQQNGYYHVQLTSTLDHGWIYRTLVRRREGDLPDTVEIGGGDYKPHPNYQRHLRLGEPKYFFVRAREGYVTGHDARLKIPVWVQYELTRDDINGPANREDDFRADYSIPYGSRADLSDYSGSGFDRGHLAPAADMKSNEEEMSESFVLSNIAPQVGNGFNRRIWKELEEAIRGWVQQRGSLTIITGPVFAVQGGSVKYEVIGDNHVAVPTHFFKIVVDANDLSNVQALTFLMPNKDLGDDHFREYLSSIDKIEKMTGMDFLSRLPVTLQTDIESVKAKNLW